ncbi:MAG: polysulfide reductase NrfD [Dehalococcoidales bacterium]|nr:MAG: polysulfide reductase NrfD [Dehalococcoidales bacterium]
MLTNIRIYGARIEENIQNIDEFLKSRSIKPQHEWGWQVAVYLYLAGIGSGSMAIGLLMYWLGYIPDGLRPIILWGPVLVAIGALFLVLKLGVKRRFLNTIMNPMTSWLSRGFYILSVCIVIGGVDFLISLLPYLNIDIEIWSWLITSLDIISFIFALGTAVYTGILIMSVRYVPFWDTWLLPALFTVSALSTGAMAIMLVSTGYNIFATSTGFPEQMVNTLSSLEQVMIVIEAIVLASFIFTRYRIREYGMYSVQLLLSGNLKYVFWMGIIVCGFLFPIILEGVYSRLHDQHFLLFLAGAFLLLGGFFIRYVIIYAGIKEEPPMQRWLENRNYLEVINKNSYFQTHRREL